MRERPRLDDEANVRMATANIVVRYTGEAKQCSRFCAIPSVCSRVGGVRSRRRASRRWGTVAVSWVGTGLRDGRSRRWGYWRSRRLLDYLIPYRLLEARIS